MADAVKKRRWMPVILGLSLALNFAVLAAVGGAAWRHNGEERGEPRTSKGGALYMKALPRESRLAIHEKTRGVGRMERGSGDMLAALRDEPFDPAAAARVLDAQRDAGLLRRDAATAAWLSEVTAMTVQERADYADRLEAMSKRGKGMSKERKARED
ncbi:periplasmic heavy metal sensor [Sulfitobacter sp.]|jgi:hypothetical protein|uniref:periplasmic heavy metal sensor n=1 Tax=Sulfitobacter sp. TaxID=1903071 RepID=UPI003EF237FA